MNDETPDEHAKRVLGAWKFCDWLGLRPLIANAIRAAEIRGAYRERQAMPERHRQLEIENVLLRREVASLKADFERATAQTEAAIQLSRRAANALR